jgi:catechol 2,3-dioxygenase-like lactoylglutathione lyase family enzyme
MNVTGIDASYYWAQDLDRATSFYTALLGQPPVAQIPGVFSEWVFAGGEAFGLYKGEEFRTSDGIMFAVADVAEAVAEMRARGVHFSGDGYIEDTPACHMAFGKDSEGNGFILHKRK